MQLTNAATRAPFISARGAVVEGGLCSDSWFWAPQQACQCRYPKVQNAQYLGLVSIVVRDYDEALAFYVGKLGFGGNGCRVPDPPPQY
jgi:hypothetical protein